MKQFNNFEKIFAILFLLFAIGFNLWTYRLERTATTDPNDNNFQFALVYRTNQIWDFATKKCSGNILTFPVCHFSYLADHWVPNWNEGYNLPFYYAHVPQIMIVGSYRLLTSIPDFSFFIFHFSFATFSLFQYYHFIIYGLFSLFPLSIFLALLVLDLPWITAGLGALLASHLSTDGLYGLDPTSFLWRGYGLSSQLFAMIWLPLAIAFSYKFLVSSVGYQVSWKQIAAKGMTKFSQGISELRTQENFRQTRSNFLLAALFLILTTAGHLGIGMMTFLALVPLTYASPIVNLLRGETTIKEFINAFIQQTAKLALLAGVAIFFQSYFILPAMLTDKFHNFSFWDPIWKFNSYGAPETITRLFNGDLFDFGRLPIFTWLVLIGGFVAIAGSIKALRASGVKHFAQDDKRIAGPSKMIYAANSLAPFTFLFLFFLLLYFGRTTWGGFIDLIPGMKEFHLSRFIVGVHIAGLFLAPIGLTWLATRISYVVARILPKLTQDDLDLSAFIGLLVQLVIGLFVFLTIYPQTIKYAAYNDVLIKQANTNAAKQLPWANDLLTTLKKLPPGRVFAGRGGAWGKTFRVAETPVYMYLSNFGLPSVLWLPETWSMNSDVEQYFRDGYLSDYDLFNMRYVAAPTNLPKENIQSFWQLKEKTKDWNLYEVPTSGYFAVGVRPAIVSTSKYSFTNVERLWIQSDDPKNGLYPEITLKTTDYPKNTGLPNFKMLDEVTYVVPDGTKHNVFSEPPKYMANYELGSTNSEYKNMTLKNERVEFDMTFSTRVSVPKNCTECIVVLKQTYHPNWKASVDGVPVAPISVFPFYLAVPVSEGNHTIVFSYEPSSLKVGLIYLEVCVAIAALVLWFRLRHTAE